MAKSSTASVSVAIGATLASSFNSTFGAADSRIRKIGSSLSDFKAKGQQLEQLRAVEQRASGGVQTLTARIDKQRATLAAAEARVASLKEKIAAAGDPTGKFAVRLDTAEQSLLRAKAAMVTTDAQLVKAKADLASASEAAGQFAASQTRIGSAIQRLEPIYQRYEGLQKRIASNQARRDEYRKRGVELAAIGYGLKKLVDSAAEGEQAKLHLGFTLQGDREQIGAVIARTRAFVRSGLASMPDMLRIEMELSRAGIEAQALPAAAEVAHKVAAVTEQEAGPTARAIGAIYNQAGKYVDGATPEAKLRRIGGLVAQMQHQFNFSDVSEIGAAFARVVPQAAAMRLPIEQAAAAMGILARNGQDAGQMRMLLINLPKASQKLGFTIARDERGEVDLAATLRRMNAAVMTTHGSIENGRAAINAAFGGRAANMVLTLSQRTAELDTEQRKLGEGAGRFDGEYKELMDSAKGTLLIIKKNYDYLMKPIGKALLPGVKAVIEPIGKLAVYVGGFLERHPALAKAIGTTTVSLFGLAAASWAIGYAWNMATGTALRMASLLTKLRLLTIAHKLETLGLAGAQTTEAAAANGAAAANERLAIAESGATRGGVAGKIGALAKSLWGVGAAGKAAAIGLGSFTVALGVAAGAAGWINWEKRIKPGLEARAREARRKALHDALANGDVRPEQLRERGYTDDQIREIFSGKTPVKSSFNESTPDPEAYLDKGEVPRPLAPKPAPTPDFEIGSTLRGMRVIVSNPTSKRPIEAPRYSSSADRLRVINGGKTTSQTAPALVASAPGDLTIQNSFVINAAPGQSADQIARQIQQQIDRATREAWARRRSAMHG